MAERWKPTFRQGAGFEILCALFEPQLERAIEHNPIFLLIVSEHSIDSDWVRAEAEMARELEKSLGRNVLCPIALDDFRDG